MRRLSIALLIGLAIVFCSRCVSRGTEPAIGLRIWDFEADQVGRAAAGFRTGFGNWTVAADGGNHVLAQTARNEDSAFNVTIRSDILYSDVEVSVRVKAVKGLVDQGGGVIWRLKNAKSYYLARYNPLEDSFRVYKVLDGKRFQMGSARAPGDANWHTIRVSMRGPAIDATFDDKIHIMLDDSTIRGYGRVGLWTKSDAQSYFDEFIASGTSFVPKAAEPARETREFTINGDRSFLAGLEIDLWGLRCGNAFVSDAVTERFIRNFDNMNAHGINFIGADLQGASAGFPNAEAGLNGFTRDGQLRPEVARRAEWFIREADKRGMVVMIGVISPRRDRDFYDEAAMRNAVEETARFLTRKKLSNVCVNLVDEFNDPTYAEKALIREPDGAKKKAAITAWFKALAPKIPAGICPHGKSGTANTYAAMDLRIIEKGMAIPKEGFVVNVGPIREDYFQNDGIFNQSSRDAVYACCRKCLDARNAVYMFDSAFAQGITNYSGTAPHGEMGGSGTGPTDRGIRFYYEWVRDNVGRWEYPHHVPADEFSLEP